MTFLAYFHPFDCEFIHSREQDPPSLDPTLEETSQSLPINNPTKPPLPPNKLPPAVRINNPQFQTNLFWHTLPPPVISPWHWRNFFNHTGL